ncbi:MAG: NAD(+)/NADH kinase [Deltaproteobacteria bacterium]|jgi:NAD+ kinase|nr:NAD(+)/NADH kinase [Deltaproteobacteria bacterium]
MRLAPAICLLAKKNDPPSLALAAEMEKPLRARGFKVLRRLPAAGLSSPRLTLSIGGDGTLISAARLLIGTGIPLAGVNTGRVGFLPALRPDNWRESLFPALERGLILEKRLALGLEVARAGQSLFSGPAVNDAALSRGSPARLPAFEIFLNGEKLVYLRADGLILSSPTGSTAYSGSAGGPQLYPTLQAYSLTPLCPFQTRLSSLVLGAEDSLCITVREACAKLYFTVDGQEGLPLRAGDEISARGLPEAVLLARFDLESGYCAKLRSAGFVADSPGGRACALTC